MIKHKYIDILVMIFVIFSLIITVGLMLPGHWGITPAYQLPAYASKLFDQSYVHTIDIQLENPQNSLLWIFFLSIANHSATSFRSSNTNDNLSSYQPLSTSCLRQTVEYHIILPFR